LGAHEYIDTTTTDAGKALQAMGGARAILCTAPNSQAMAGLIPGLGSNGKLIIVTGAGEPMSFSPFLLLRGGRSITGFVGGNIEDTLKFSVLVNVIPMVEVFPLEQAAIAYEKMMKATVHFRAVLVTGA
jgi:D-arabinose 1-dehydrogenase-like Zn-dependent alcohol dehydrogenase